MIHAAVFRTTDPAERATLVVTGAPDQIALNTPVGGCWRRLPSDATQGDLPMLGSAPGLSGAAGEGEQAKLGGRGSSG